MLNSIQVEKILCKNWIPLAGLLLFIRNDTQHHMNNLFQIIPKAFIKSKSVTIYQDAAPIYN